MGVVKKLAGFLIPVALFTVASVTYAKPLKLPIHIAAVEVSIAEKLDAPALAEKISKEVLIERDYYMLTGRAAIMHITVNKLTLKSAGKAMLGSIPIINMFAGSNENMVRANIKLVDQLSGETLGEYKKMQIYDSMGFSAGDLAGELGSTALSFIPIPFLGEALSMAGGMAASTGSREVAEVKMSKNLARMAFYEIYGKAVAKIASRKRKEAHVAKQLAAKNAAALMPSSVITPTGTADVEKAVTAEPIEDIKAKPEVSAQPPIQ